MSRTARSPRQLAFRRGLRASLGAAAVSSTNTLSLPASTAPRVAPMPGPFTQRQVSRVRDQELALGVREVAAPARRPGGSGWRRPPPRPPAQPPRARRRTRARCRASRPRGTDRRLARPATKPPARRPGCTTSAWVRRRSPTTRPSRVSPARASTAPVMVSGAPAGAAGGATGAAGCVSAALTASPNVSDLGWNADYWNTLHFSPSRVTVAGSASGTDRGTVDEDVQLHGIRHLQRRLCAAQVRRAAR